MARNNLQFRVNAVRGITVAVALTLGAAALPLQAQEQVDISGSWVAPGTENIMERAAGPVSGNFTGMPINANERVLADSYSSGMLAEPERICQLYNQWEWADGPWNLRFWPEIDPNTRAIVAWVIGGAESEAGTTIWMDGRPEPSDLAPHDRAAFSTGSWVHNMLVVRTTHLKSAAIRRNGVFNSDKATMTSIFAPHDDLLTATYVMEDPVYLTEPYIYARSYNRSPERSVSPHWDPCIVNYEGVAEGSVPFFLPGKNPLLTQMTEIYHIPEYASQGGAETMYPEIRDKMKAKFVASYHTFPKTCTLYCSTGFRPPAPPKTAGKAPRSGGG